MLALMLGRSMDEYQSTGHWSIQEDSPRDRSIQLSYQNLFGAMAFKAHGKGAKCSSVTELMFFESIPELGQRN